MLVIAYPRKGMADESTTESTDTDEQPAGAAKGAGSQAAASPSSARQKAATPAEPEAPAAADDDAEQTYPLARLLHPAEGPEILKCEWHTIVGAFDKELAEIKTDASAAAAEMSKSAALARIEEWLGREVVHDNEVPA